MKIMKIYENYETYFTIVHDFFNYSLSPQLSNIKDRFASSRSKIKKIYNNI